MSVTSDFTLNNGLRVIVAENHSTPVAAVSVWVRAGACEEPAGQRGIAHFLEHMMFRGSKRFAAKEHTHRIERMGGDVNAYTSPDATVFHQTVPADRVGDVLELEADRFKHPLLASGDMETERKVILEELDSFGNQPIQYGFNQLQRFIGEGHPYAIYPGGVREQVQRLTPEQLRQFHSKFYSPRNAYVVVCGAVDTAQIAALARQHFDDWASPEPRAPDRPLYHPKTGALRVKLPFQAPLAVRAFALKPAQSEDEAALHVLLSLLAKGASAPLTEDLVRKRKLCVFADGEIFQMQTGGMLALFGAFLPPTRFKTVRAAIKAHCDRLSADGPDPALLPQIVKRFKKQKLNEAYHPNGRMQGLGNAELMQNDYRRYERIVAGYAGVTPERIRTLARVLFAPENTLELDIVPEDMKWWMWPAGLLMKVWRR